MSATDSILEAVKNRWNAVPALATTFPGGLWTNEVPEIELSPYASIDLNSSDYILSFEESYLEESSICFHLYGGGAATMEAAAKQVKTAFDNCKLHYAIATHLHILPRSYRIESLFQRSQDGTLLFRVDLDYDVAVFRPN